MLLVLTAQLASIEAMLSVLDWRLGGAGTSRWGESTCRDESINVQSL
jgi:hypothetical protein